MDIDRISSSLDSLLHQDSDDMSVIVESTQSGHFLQFTGSRTEQLILDVPVIELTQPEKRRVQELLSPHMPVLEQWGDDPNESSYVIKLGQDVSKAVELVELLFGEAFGLSNDAVRVKQLT